MSRFTNIAALADDVLATVVNEARMKTASASVATAPKYIVPTAQELRKLAAELRAHPDDSDEATPEDLAALQEDPEVADLLALIEQHPEMLEQLMQQNNLDAPSVEEEEPEAVSPAVVAEGDPSTPPVKAAHASADLRKLAQVLRKSADVNLPRRRVQAAAMLHAATGIQHLLGVTK